MATERTLDGVQHAARLSREAKRVLGVLPNIHKKSTNFRAKAVHGLLIDDSTFEKNAPMPPGTLEIPQRQTDDSAFDKSAPTPPGTLELPPEPDDPPLRPEPQDAIYVPVYSLFDKISVRRRELKDREARARFEDDLARWEERKSERLESWQAECARLQKKHDALLKKFEKEHQEWEQDLARWEERKSERLESWQAKCARLQKKHDGC